VTPAQTNTGKASNVSLGTKVDKPSLATDHESYQMSARHDTLQGLWDEWYGIGSFIDEYGGIEGRNNVHGTKWRTKRDVTFQSRYSTNRRIVIGIAQHANQCGVTPEAVLVEWQSLFEKCSCSPYCFIKMMQDNGLFVKQETRGRKHKKQKQN
jgi:hypothetical protein